MKLENRMIFIVFFGLILAGIVVIVRGDHAQGQISTGCNRLPWDGSTDSYLCAASDVFCIIRGREGVWCWEKDREPKMERRPASYGMMRQEPQQ